MKRNLIYYIYPVRNSIWEWNVRMLMEYIHVFNHKIIVYIAVDSSTDHPDTVKSAFDVPAKFFVGPNDPKTGESRAFPSALSHVRSIDPDEITFYAHAKGVVRTKKRPLEAPNIRAWVEAMYKLNLSYPEDIEKILRLYSTTGAFLREIPNHGGSNWHFAGTFFWFRNYDIFRRNWRYIALNYYGVEGWIGKHISKSRAFSLFDTPKNMYATQLDPAEYRSLPWITQ